jgi:hypothetical protein
MFAAETIYCIPVLQFVRSNFPGQFDLKEARPVPWLWNECRKRSHQRQLAVYCRRRESKMEIPVKSLHTGKPVSYASLDQAF